MLRSVMNVRHTNNNMENHHLPAAQRHAAVPYIGRVRIFVVAMRPEVHGAL
jgi:hypothetical protein